MTSDLKVAGLIVGQPFAIQKATVAAAQTNALGHLKASEYVRLFDDAVNLFFPLAGLADARLLHGTTSPFLMDMHVCYLAELRVGDSVEIAFMHLDDDTGRARAMMTMRKSTDGKLAATVELLLINMDTATRAPAPWSATQIRIWQQFRVAHAALPSLPQAGRSIGPLSKRTAG